MALDTFLFVSSFYIQSKLRHCVNNVDNIIGHHWHVVDFFDIKQDWLVIQIQIRVTRDTESVHKDDL